MRIRTIKPEFFTHEELFDAEQEEGLPLRVAFAGLWCASDREGRFKWEPRRLKTLILPYDEVDFSRVLHALTTRGFVVRYASGTRSFGYIPSFLRHQVINNRESKSELPDPLSCLDSDACATRAPRVNHACATPLVQDQGEGKGREGNKEGKGREGSGSARAHAKAVAGKAEEPLPEILGGDKPETSTKAGFPEKSTALDYAASQNWPEKSALSWWLHRDSERSTGEARFRDPNWHWWSDLERWVLNDARTGGGSSKGGEKLPRGARTTGGKRTILDYQPADEWTEENLRL